MIVWSNDGTELMYLNPTHVLPVQPGPLNSMMGPAFAKWYAANGQQGTAFLAGTATKSGVAVPFATSGAPGAIVSL